MPEFDKLSKYVDKAAVQAETAFLISEFKKVEDEALKMAKILADSTNKLGSGGLGMKASIDEINKLDAATKRHNENVKSGFSDITKLAQLKQRQSKEELNSLEDLIKKRITYQNTLKSVKAEEKDNLALLKDGVITQSEYKKRLIESAIEQEKYKLRISETSKEIKNLQTLQLSPANSQKEARAQNVVLTRERELTPVQDVNKIKALNDAIDKNNDLIDQNSDKLGKQKINIGNYPSAFTGAFNSLNKELDNINKKIASSAGGKELQELTNKQQVLATATQTLGKEFSNTSAQQNAFKETAKQIGLTFGTNSTTFKDFNKQVGNGSKELKNVAKEVDNAATGGSKAAKSFGSIFSVIRQIANLIPGLGLSGVFLLMLAPLSQALSGVLNFFKAITDGKEKVRALNEVNLKSIEIYNDEKSKVEGLTSVVSDNSISLNTREAALKQLIDISPEYLRGLTLENAATAEGKILLDNYIDSLESKAKLQAATTVKASADKDVAVLEAQKTALLNLGKTGKAVYSDLTEDQLKYFDNSTSIGRINFSASVGTAIGFDFNVSQSDIKEAIKNVDKELLKANLKLKASTDVFKEKFAADFSATSNNKKKIGIIQDLKDKIAALNKELPTLLSVDLITKNIRATKNYQDELDKLMGKTKNNNKATMQSTKEKFDADFENYKRDQQRKIQFLNDDANNEKNSFEKQISLLNEYSTAKIELIKVTNEKESDIEKDKLKVLQANLKVAKGTERNNIIAEIKNTKERIKDIENKTSDEIALVINDNEKKFNEIRKKEADNYLKIQGEKYDKSIKEVERYNLTEKELSNKNYTEAVEGLEQRRKDGEISEQQFNDKKLKLDFAYSVETLKIEAETIKKKLALKALLGQNVAKELYELSKIEKEIAKLTGKYVEDVTKKNIEKIVKGLEKVKAASEEAFKVISGIMNAQQVAEKNKLRDEQDAAEKKAAKDIEIVNASTLSEQDKAAKISVINARLAAQKEEIARKERRAEIDKLKFEKAATVFRLSLELAKAIVSTNIFKIIAATAQLAVAIATPIPRFKHGLNKDYEGMAVVGDGGKKEVIKRKDGSIEITPSTDTLTYINKGDRVLPDADIFLKQMQESAMNDVVRTAKGQPITQTSYGKAMIAAINRQTNILNDIKAKPTQTIHGTERGLVSLIQYGTTQINFINDNCNF